MRILLTAIFMALLGSIGYAQGQDLLELAASGRVPATDEPGSGAIHQRIADRKQQGAFFAPTQLFVHQAARQNNHLSRYVAKACYLDLDQPALSRLLAQPMRDLALAIPVATGRELWVEVTQTSITAPGFRMETSSGKQNWMAPSGLFYQGIVRGYPDATVVVSLFERHARILITDASGVYLLGQLRDGSGRHILFSESQLQMQDNWVCDTPDTPLPKREAGPTAPSAALMGSRCVQVYVETDFQVYQDRGSEPIEVADYVFGVFNEAIAAYAAIDVKMEISALFIWDETDPYTAEDDTDGILTAFVAARPTFEGTLAHLITTRSMGGLAHGIGGICSNAPGLGPYCMSGGLSSADPAGLPTTSSTFIRVAHEMGHVLGSRHSHACVWGPANDAQMDDCGNVWATTNLTDDDGDGTIDEVDEAEGGGCFDPNNPVAPATANGAGTIMSYCHLTSSRDLLNGFGDQPASVIRATIMGAMCLSEDCSCEAFAHRTVNGAPIPSAVYQAALTITSSGEANTAGGVVIFKAGESITLEPGFEAEALFIAEIVPGLCDDIEKTSIAVRNNPPEGSPEIQPEYGLRIYPNPTTRNLQVYGLTKATSGGNIAVFNALGQPMPLFIQQVDEGVYQIEVSAWPAGLYWLAAITPNGPETIIFVKENE